MKAFGFLGFHNKMGDFSEADLCVSLRNEGRDYNEHFQTYKFYFSMRMTFFDEDNGTCEVLQNDCSIRCFFN